ARCTVGRSSATRENSAATNTAVPPVRSTAASTSSHSVTAPSAPSPLGPHQPSPAVTIWTSWATRRGVDDLGRTPWIRPSGAVKEAFVTAASPATPAPQSRGGSSSTVDPMSGRIEARGLTKKFGRLTAVDHLDLDVVPGRITGFLGPNGAGKTTTLRML